MKLNSLSVLCLSLLLFLTLFSPAKGRGGKSGGSRKPSSTSRGGTHTNTDKGHKNTQGSSSRGGNPKQSGQNNQGGSPPQSGRPGHRGSYPRQHTQYPQRGHDGQGVYPGGFINQNPNNRILNPRYGGSLGYGGYGAGGGSPFSRSVHEMGVFPNTNSRGYARTAVVAAAGGAVAGMAVGYGLGRQPRPHFQFHSRQEEQYYNHYTYRKYGAKSTDTNDYSRDYTYSQPPVTYDNYMDSCMNKPDLLAEHQKPKSNPAVTVTTTTAVVTSASNTSSNTTETNSTAAEKSLTPAPSTPRRLNQPEGSPVPPASQAASSAEDDDTVSIVEVGYPALIEQLKIRKCLEEYMVYSDKYLKKNTGERLEMGLRGLLALVTSTIVMLLNSNMLMLH